MIDGSEVHFGDEDISNEKPTSRVEDRYEDTRPLNSISLLIVESALFLSRLMIGLKVVKPSSRKTNSASDTDDPYVSIAETTTLQEHGNEEGGGVKPKLHLKRPSISVKSVSSPVMSPVEMIVSESTNCHQTETGASSEIM
tara:strand:- start:254 stop:676 length:423 start_codon:yes stop_codon:yes gene_type:complete